MSNQCKELKNTGVPACAFLMSIARRLIIVPEFKADGTKNELATVDNVDKATLQALFVSSDIDDRYFPLPEMENVEEVKGDAVYFEWNSGNKVFIREGARSFTGMIPLAHPMLKSKLDAFKSQNLGVHIIDKNKNFVYETDVSTRLKVMPILIDGNSLDVKLVKTTDSDPSHLMVSFDFKVTNDDAYLRYISYDEGNLDFDGLSNADVYAVTDVDQTLTPDEASTEAVAVLKTHYDTPLTGLLITDLALYNTTQSATLTPDSVTESPDGTYTLDLSTEDGGGGVVTSDVMTATWTKAKYDIAVGTGTYS